MSKSLVTASTLYSEVTSLFRGDPPIAWYLAIGSAAIMGKPRYIGTDGPRILPPAVECGFVKTLWKKLGMRNNHTAGQRNNRTEQLAELTAPLRHRNPEPYTMPCAAREQCLIQDRTPQAPDGLLYRGMCSGRLHGLCGEVEDPDSDEPMHRICQTCAIAKATATGSSSGGKSTSTGKRKAGNTWARKYWDKQETCVRLEEQVPHSA